MTDIFLSYAREDLERARTMARALEDEGWSVFWDRRIPPGRRFEDYIEERIKQARVVVVLWSPDSVVSDWVRLEAAHARDRKPSALIPVVIAPLTPPAEIPFAFRHIQAADLSGWQAGARGIEFEEMLASIESLAPRPRMPTRPVASESTSVSSRQSSLPTEPSSARQAPSVADTPPVAPRSEPVDLPSDWGPELSPAAPSGPIQANLALLSGGNRLIAATIGVAAIVAVGVGFYVNRETSSQSATFASSAPAAGSNQPRESSTPSGGSPAAAPETPVVVPPSPTVPTRTSGSLVEAVPSPTPAVSGGPAVARPIPPTADSTARPTAATVDPQAGSYPATLVLPVAARVELLRVSAGPFLMGSDKKEDPNAEDDEVWPGQGQGSPTLRDFYIGKYEVTVAQYKACVEAKACAPKESTAERLRLPDAPVVNVSWSEALQYCEWLDRTVKASTAGLAALKSLPGDGWRVSLPSEAEWEKAARGTDGRTYPWGEGVEPDRANYGNRDGPMAVGSFPRGASPYGALDMSGNVWEWTRSLYKSYPYVASDGREDLKASGRRVLRGGAYVDLAAGRAAKRGGVEPNVRGLINLGFRVVVSRF